jgi:hypothetical protein
MTKVHAVVGRTRVTLGSLRRELRFGGFPSERLGLLRRAN